MLSRADILHWLREDDAVRLEDLWGAADGVRAEFVGDEVHLRGLLEVSNHCVRRCAYCGISAARSGLPRYRMSAEEILEGARAAHALGYGTVVVQAGEDYGLSAGAVADTIRRIKEATPLAVTLSLGERPLRDLVLWRQAGADRYLLRFETSDRSLYDLIHPPHAGRRSDRLALLRQLRELGYETGGGVMVGIPGQSWDSLASDIVLFRDLDLDMIGIGPFIAHPATTLGSGTLRPVCSPSEQVPADALTTCKAIALARLTCPEANIPSTTALASLDSAHGREPGLARGANVVMPNITPARYRIMYDLYPGKAGATQTAEACSCCLADRISSMGRRPGAGPGGRRRRTAVGAVWEGWRPSPCHHDPHGA